MKIADIIRATAGVAFCAAISAAPIHQSSANSYPNGISGEEIKEIAETLFQNVTLQTDYVGDPLVTATVSTNQFQSVFAIGTDNCTRDQVRRCEDITFFIYKQGPFTPTVLPRLNDYNAQALYGQVYLDSDRDISLYWAVDVPQSTPEYVRRQMTHWVGVLALFAQTDFTGTGGSQSEEEIASTAAAPALEGAFADAGPVRVTKKLKHEGLGLRAVSKD